MPVGENAMTLEMNEAVYSMKSSILRVERMDDSLMVKITTLDGKPCSWGRVIDEQGSFETPKTSLIRAAVDAACLLYGASATKKYRRFGADLGRMPKCEPSKIGEIEQAIKMFMK